MSSEAMAVQPGFRGWPECEVCGQRVTQGDGVLEVSRSHGLEIYRREWEHEVDEAIEEREAGGPIARLIAGEPRPERAHWRWTHRNCDTNSAYDYWIPTERFDSYAKVLGWMAHLREKLWFESTDWYAAVSKAWAIDYGA